MTDIDKKNKELENTGEENLEAKLEEVLEEVEVDETQAMNQKLEKELEEQRTITQRAQSDYLRLNMDMNVLRNRAEEDKKNAEIDAIVKIWAKILPTIAQLEQSNDHIPEEIADEAYVKGVGMYTDKLQSSISELGITKIETIVGSDPDLTLHMPISMEPTEDEAMKGKITRVVEAGYQVTKNDINKVISPAKIIVGS